MYVTGYLQNPASFFGHTLLKFNRGNRNQSLLDRSLNYGAETNNDAALPYVIKGLIGKYKAALQEESFFRLSAEYQEFQMSSDWISGAFSNIWEPLLVGALIIGIISSALGYFIMHLLWRLYAYNRLNKSKKS